MKVRTGEVKTNISIRVYADLTGWDSTETSIKNKILNTSFNHWVLDDFNSLDMGNNEILDMFVYEVNNRLIFNVNDIM